MMTDNVTCKICSASSRYFGTARILNRHDVRYFRCDKCEFVQTEEPYWLEEAYSEAINRCDVGLVSRNLDLRGKTAAVLLSFFDCEARFLDYGGGYGLFVRLMRDAGFDFYWDDKHCDNIFARHFAAAAGGRDTYELVTAFELFEHLAHPLEEIDKMLGHSRNILFTTELMPAGNPLPGDWWYYIPDYGQHISFYTLKTLNVIAERCCLRLYSDGKFFHLLTERRISPLAFRVVSRKRVAAILAAISRRESKVPADYRKITGS
jgi:hypothetical protein